MSHDTATAPSQPDPGTPEPRRPDPGTPDDRAVPVGRREDQGGRLVTVTVPDDASRDALTVPDGVQLELWDLTRDLPAEVAATVDVVVVPHGVVGETLRRLRDVPHLAVVQLPSAGFEHVMPHLPPGVTLCNGRGVHDDETAELALALTLASLRGLDDYLRAQDRHEWTSRTRPSLADRRALVIGHGAIGAAVARRLEAFVVDVVRVASTAREEDGVQVHGVDELPDLLPGAEVVILTVPLTDETDGLVDAGFLARMPDGALLVNVARGKVVDTGALLAELRSGRLRAALDVTDPEPLPAEHPLWSAPGLILTPHEGGNTTATPRRMTTLVQDQLERLAAGRELENVVART
ncbi:2-hydroxyacid dehydrogenase [Cellulomonas aerilata]|uniref:Dehydrogenase n=1 Tax=Cellulomonas aerilata TaxID=515326 RepID=A0A512DGU5_9CELL|nr:2-hydroxyacid dehydrogenase [Cellulomonas aerilata]GEO35703.1 dehydrogenase [Cellulomonas aerilata]